MTTALFDIITGISGDMTIAALIDAGADFNYLKSLFNYCVGDEFSHDDPFDSDFEDEFLP